MLDTTQAKTGMLDLKIPLRRYKSFPTTSQEEDRRERGRQKKQTEKTAEERRTHRESRAPIWQRGPGTTLYRSERIDFPTHRLIIL